MRRSVAAAAVMTWTTSATADCPEPSSSAVLVEVAQRAESALALADADAYRSADDDMHRLLPCIDTLIPVDLAASVHRTSGVRAFLDRDLERAELRFATARMLAPGYTWPDALLPPSHPIRSAYIRTPLMGLMFEIPARPRRGFVAVDGRIGQGRLEGLPSIFQAVGSDGVATQTVLLAPNAPFPSYAERGNRRVRPSTIGSIGAFIGAAVFFGAALDARHRYNDLDTPYEALDGHKSRITAFSITSMALVTIGTGAGIAAVVPRTSR